jgi:hypothetical protein
MTAGDLIAECERQGVLLVPALDFEGPEDILAEGLEARLRERKTELIRVLVGSAGTDVLVSLPGLDWRFEWLREVGMLALRWRDATDAEVKALLRELLAETPTTLAEWLRLGAMIRDTEFDLRRAGKLPQIPNFGP